MRFLPAARHAGTRSAVEPRHEAMRMTRPMTAHWDAEDLGMLMLAQLPAARGSAACSLLDHIASWSSRKYSGAEIRDSLDWLFKETLIQTDAPELSPQYPWASIVLRSPTGDDIVDANEKLTLQKRFGLALRLAKDRRGWKSRELAEVLAVTPSYLSQTLRGKRDVKLSMISRVARCLGMRPAHLLAPLRHVTLDASMETHS
jgi:plasmid maintenance system antidote protein VapI